MIIWVMVPMSCIAMAEGRDHAGAGGLLLSPAWSAPPRGGRHSILRVADDVRCRKRVIWRDETGAEKFRMILNKS